MILLIRVIVVIELLFIVWGLGGVKGCLFGVLLTGRLVK
jgi:hypothetical protein